jgi:hypothetical protein
MAIPRKVVPLKTRWQNTERASKGRFLRAWPLPESEESLWHLRRESGALRHENAQSPSPRGASLLPRYDWHHCAVGKMNRGTCTPMIVLIIATMISLSALGMLAACANE